MHQPNKELLDKIAAEIGDIASTFRCMSYRTEQYEILSDVGRAMIYHASKLDRLADDINEILFDEEFDDDTDEDEESSTRNWTYGDASEWTDDDEMEQSLQDTDRTTIGY